MSSVIDSLSGTNLNIFQKVLRVIASAMQTPVIIVLIFFIAFALFSIGWVIVKMFAERRHMNTALPALLDGIQDGGKDLKECITGSGLLKKHKEMLLELTRHPDFDAKMIQSLADNELDRVQSYYDRILKATDLVAKLAPMAGLLGTLIPLGPGIIALGQGDTLTLSTSMLTAFDTTIAGLLAAGTCLVVSTVRRRWYAAYMSDLETLADCIVDREAVS